MLGMSKRGHSLALKCLKIKETSSFCPSCVQNACGPCYMGKNNRYTV